MKVFITGASGFIGSYVYRNLIQAGHAVLAMKRPTTNLWRINDCSSQSDWIEDSECFDEELCKFAPDVIINLAWNGVEAIDRSNWNVQESNILMQQRLLDIAHRCGTKKFIGAGSQSEYGDFEGTIDENYPVNPKTAYAASKVSCLYILKTFCELNGLEWYWFRIFPQFGPFESTNWLIPSLIKSICTQDHMDLTPGEQQLPYLYVGECANAITAPLNTSNKSGIYNICADNPQSLKELVTSIRDRINPSFDLRFGALPYRYGQSMYMCGDTRKLRDNLYVMNTSSYEEKMQETIKYYLHSFRDE